MYILHNPHNSEKIYLRDIHNEGQNHITWEIESSCSLGCKYCYTNRTKNGTMTVAKVQTLIRQINDSGIKHIHLTGGEPTKSPYLEYIVKTLQNKRIYITTNLVENIDFVEKLLLCNDIYSIAVSLDAVDTRINDMLRGRTTDVLSNIEKLLCFKKKHNLKTKIRIHCVISKVNLDYIPELLHWAKSINIDEVSCQPISIDQNHKYYHLLHLECSDIEKIKNVLLLEGTLFESAYANAHSLLVEYYLKNNQCYINDCRKLCSIYIDAKGDIWNCPIKQVKLSNLGCVCQEGTCNITPQCMCCLKHLEVSE